MQLKRAVACFVTVSGIAMMSVIGQETRTEETASGPGKTGEAADETGTSRESNEDLKDRNQLLRERYGIGAAEASPRQSQPATKTGYELDPLLAERYGLTPSGGASRTGQGARPPTDLRLPADGRRAGTAAPGLAAGILDGEAGGDLNQAIQAYRGVIEDFDARRGDAAQAVFRLGEAYRRKGMAADARLQYARILREFPDQAELARMSLDRISEPIRDSQTGSYAALPPTSAIPTTPESLKTQLELFQQELELMEREIQAAERQQEAGVASSSEVSSLKREALGLKRQIAILEGQIDSTESLDGGSGESGDVSFGSSSGGFGGGFVSESGFGRRDPFRKSREELALERELAMLQERLLEKREESMDLDERYTGIRGADPTRIPSRYIDDPRYQELKAAYEQAFLLPNFHSNSPFGGDAETTGERLKQWVEKIYLPELKTEIEDTERQKAVLEHGIESVEQRLTEMEKERLNTEAQKPEAAERRTSNVER